MILDAHIFCHHLRLGHEPCLKEYCAHKAFPVIKCFSKSLENIRPLITDGELSHFEPQSSNDNNPKQRKGRKGRKGRKERRKRRRRIIRDGLNIRDRALTVLCVDALIAELFFRRSAENSDSDSARNRFAFLPGHGCPSLPLCKYRKDRDKYMKTAFPLRPETSWTKKFSQSDCEHRHPKSRSLRK